VTKKTKKEQIAWLVDWYKDQKIREGLAYLDAQDFDLWGEFEEFSPSNLSYELWRSRIRDAAAELGLSGSRTYIADATPSAGIPRYTMTYS
jgi:hypothetical protein